MTLIRPYYAARCPHRRHFDPDHAAAAQLHRRDLPDHRRSRRPQRHLSLHALRPVLRPAIAACAHLRGRDHYGPARIQIVIHGQIDVAPYRPKAPARLRPRASPRRAARLRAGQATKRTSVVQSVGQSQMGLHASATARPRAAPACATCSAARARALPRWPISACRCRPASPSPPRSARITTPTGNAIPQTLRRRSTPRSPGRPHHRQDASATAAIRCWCRCARARARRCPA